MKHLCFIASFYLKETSTRVRWGQESSSFETFHQPSILDHINVFVFQLVGRMAQRFEGNLSRHWETKIVDLVQPHRPRGLVALPDSIGRRYRSDSICTSYHVSRSCEYFPDGFDLYLLPELSTSSRGCVGVTVPQKASSLCAWPAVISRGPVAIP